MASDSRNYKSETSISNEDYQFLEAGLVLLLILYPFYQRRVLFYPYFCATIYFGKKVKARLISETVTFMLFVYISGSQ